jgi:hypothetical protein
MVEGDERLKVQAADDRVHIWIPGGLRLTRYVRNLQVRTVVDGGLDVQGPLERTVYANPLGRSPDEEERAIVVGAPIYCRHTPALKVARFKLSLRCKAMLVAVVVASRLEETWAGQPLVDASRLLDREMLAVGLGDGLVAAAVLAAIADIRTYCRAILGKLG